MEALYMFVALCIRKKGKRDGINFLTLFSWLYVSSFFKRNIIIRKIPIKDDEAKIWEYKRSVYTF